MGIVNVTPDSFSDGGLAFDPGAAEARADRLWADGADWLDVGAESTRPGAAPVDEGEEWRRLEPVLKRLAGKSRGPRVSVDTRKPAVMRRAADLGVGMINDVSGLADPATLTALARYPGLAYAAMHMHGTPETMQKTPLPAARARATVERFFADATAALAGAGFPPERIWLDPGIGFGKTDAANVQLIAAVGELARGRQLLVGVSRKSLLGRVLGIQEPDARDAPTKTLELGLAIAGAGMLRTHDVRRLRTLLKLLTEAE
jgi:dihydropteroate synthase